MDGRTRGTTECDPEALDLVFDLHWNMPRRRRQAAQDPSGPTGTALSIEQSAGAHPRRASGRASRPDPKLTCWVGSKAVRRDPRSERQIEELDRLIEPKWLDDYDCALSRAARKVAENSTLSKVLTSNSLNRQ